jgi:DivIVA domain-containing protein
MAPEYDDRPDAVVPADGPLTAEDLRRIRFSTVVRGYRASEVDALLNRLAAQLGESPEQTPEESSE